MTGEFTEQEVIYAYQQVGLGRDAADVYAELTGNTEYAELGATALLGTVRSWYRQQTPQRLMALMESAGTQPQHAGHADDEPDR